MERATEEIKKKLDIIEFVGSYISLKKAGRNFKAVCPFHQEKTPSFVISPERQIWHCFGACQEGGDVIRFFMKWENIGFTEAVKELSNRLGIKIQQAGFEDQSWKIKERLLSINKLASEYYGYMLNKTKFGKRALEYLKNRGISGAIINKFGIGYAPNSWDSLLLYLKKKGLDKNDVFQSGLLVKNDRGNYYDRFRGRLVFPLKDHRANVVGFSGRILDTEKSEAKYINTPETILYHKRETLFGIDLAKESIKKEGVVFLVEGELDMISPYQAGVENIVAIKGSAVTKEQLYFLKRYTNRLILALDSDPAGEEAMKRTVEESEGMDFDLEIVTFDYAKDPDEAVRKDVNKFKRTIKNPLPVYDFIIDVARKKYPSNDPFDKKNLANDVIYFLEKIKNPIVQSHYVKKLAALIDVSEDSVNALIRSARRKNKTKTLSANRQETKMAKTNRDELMEKYLLGRIFQSDSPFKVAEPVFSILGRDDFFIPSHQKILDSFLSYQKNTPSFNLEKFIALLPPPVLPVFDELCLFASTDSVSDGENLIKLAHEVKKLSLKKQLTENFNQGGDQEKIKKITKELNEVEKKASSL